MKTKQATVPQSQIPNTIPLYFHTTSTHHSSLPTTQVPASPSQDLPFPSPRNAHAPPVTPQLPTSLPQNDPQQPNSMFSYLPPPSKPPSTKTFKTPLAPPTPNATLTSPKESRISSPTITPIPSTMPSAHSLHPAATFTSSIPSVSSAPSKFSSSLLFSPSNSPHLYHFHQINTSFPSNHHIITFPASKLSLGSPRLPPPPPSAIFSLSKQGSLKRPRPSLPPPPRKRIKSQALQCSIVPYLTISSSTLSLLPTPPPPAPSSVTEQQNVPW